MMWLHIDPSYRETLASNGLRGLPDFFSYGGGTRIKNLPDRTMTRLTLAAAEGEQSFFLKRHFGRMRAVDRLRNRISGFHGSWGRKEFEVIEAFRQAGIPTLHPVAAGEEPAGSGGRSFLMTAELTGFQPLHQYIQAQYTPPLKQPKLQEKRDMIQEIAAIARKMHTLGFNHRDFYCGHVFIRVDGGLREWRVLDLQRVDRRRWLRGRWIVKDLAAIYYSAPRPMITRTDCLRFLVHYFGSLERVRTAGRLLQQIVRKTERIRHHDRKVQAKRKAASLKPSDVS
ncbi:MAG: hypothetical protein OEM42_00615 [Deltaproteobacteria bacterium]|nr:hypothetical protein [Deltaproteobacteria bacterium]MDH3382542.1 hypothetical protein [Deltaproteobacteria bacterium]